MWCVYAVRRNRGRDHKDTRNKARYHSQDKRGTTWGMCFCGRACCLLGWCGLIGSVCYTGCLWVCSSFCTVVAGGETDTPHLIPPIMYTLNLCSASLRKTMRLDASFGYDTRADTWKEISLIWFGNERVTRARVRREAEREWVWGKKEIDQRGGGNGIVPQAMHFPLVKPSFVLFLTLVSNAFSDLTWQTTPVFLSGFMFRFHAPPHIISSLFVSPTEAKQTDFPS